MFKTPPTNSIEWLGLPIQMEHDQLHSHYLNRIHDLLMRCLAEHPRWTVIRVDLRSPEGCCIPENAITRFIESIKAQLKYAREVKQSAGKRAYDPMVRYVWVREWNQADQPHFHLAILLNHDAYFSLGNYGRLGDEDGDYDEMLSWRIYKAWGVALGIDWRKAQAGVHFPECPTSALMRRGPRSNRQLYGVFYRLSYFAKLQTKRFGEGARSFGMSQLPRIQASQD